jgi:long-chain acyl-CoA synthetase
VGKQVAAKRAADEPLPDDLAGLWQLIAATFAGVRGLVGLDAAQFAVTGAAPMLSALLTLDPDAAPARAAQHGKDGAELAALAGDEQVRALVEAALEEVNTRFPQVERIKRFALLGEEWLPDTEVLTPTTKLKRRGVLERYTHVIEQLYV